MPLLARRSATSRHVLWLLLALVLVVAAIFVRPAAAAPEPDARTQLERFVARTESATGRFMQSAGAAGEATRGEFAFARPGRFRWEVKEPYPQLMVADGEHVYFYDVDLAQVTIRPMDQALAATPAALLFGNGALDTHFDIAVQGEADGLQWLRAVPRERDAGFERIRLGFAGNLPVRMEVLDAFDRTSVFTFSDWRQNPPDDPARFEFQVPEGADVIRP